MVGSHLPDSVCQACPPARRSAAARAPTGGSSASKAGCRAALETCGRSQMGEQGRAHGSCVKWGRGCSIH